VEAFNADQAAAKGVTHFFSSFVAYNPPEQDAPSYFTGGAYAYTIDFGGPWVQLLYNNYSHGTNNLETILIHETGHVFWALDEYAPACEDCTNYRDFGPRMDLTNRNCEDSPAACRIDTTCIMKRNHLTLCDDTPYQIGW